jgi:hypothetical protein
VLLILIVAAIVSIVLGTVVERDLQHGWIEGAAICIAVIIVSSVSAGNDYTKVRAREAVVMIRDGTMNHRNSSFVLWSSLHVPTSAQLCCAVASEFLFHQGSSLWATWSFYRYRWPLCSLADR